MGTLKQKLESLGVDSEALDSLVDDAAQRVATRVNNEGMKEQLAYLEAAGFSEEDVLSAVAEAA